MKYLILTASILLSIAAYAQAPAQPASEPAPVAAPTTPSPQIAPAATPATGPTVWSVMDLDKRDLQDIDGYVKGCLKPSADALVELLNRKIKVVK